MECAFLEKHHWSYPELNASDVDDLMAYVVYFPQYKERADAAEKTPKLAHIDEVDWF